MPDVRMNYGSMEKMAKEFHAAHQQIEQSVTAMKKLASMMEGGALVGMGGDAYREAITGKLIPRMNILKAKMLQLEGDIMKAKVATETGVKDATARFTN